MGLMSYLSIIYDQKPQRLDASCVLSPLSSAIARHASLSMDVLAVQDVGRLAGGLDQVLGILIQNSAEPAKKQLKITQFTSKQRDLGS